MTGPAVGAAGTGGRRRPGTLWVKLVRDLRREWPQTAALVLTLTVGVALFAASFDAYGNLRDSYARVFTSQRFADLWAGASTPAAARRIAARLAGSAGVRAVAVRTQADLPLRVGGDALPGRVVGIPVATQPAVDRLTVLAGAYPATTGQVAVEKHMADHFHLHPGSVLRVHGTGGWREVTVAAVVSSAEYLWPARSRQEPLTTPDNFGVVFAPQGLVDALAPRAPAQVQVVLTDAARGDRALAAVSSLARAGGATTVTTRAEQASNSLLQEDINGLAELSYLFPLLFLGAAGMSAYVLLTRRVAAEREVIGMLLACGVRGRTVLTHYLAYGLAVGAGGGVAGVALGEGLARLVSRAYLRGIGLPGSLWTLAAARPGTVLAGVAFGVGAGAIAAFAPALAAARLAPAQAMRGVHPGRAGALSLLERIAPPLRRAPVTVRMVLRGVGRNRRRTAFTGIGVVVSLLVILTSWTMLDTISGMLGVQFGQVTRQDAQVSLGTPADAGVLAALRAVPGVTRAEPMAQVPVTLTAGPRGYGTAVIGLPADTRLHGFRLAGGGTTTLAAVPPGSVLIGAGIRQRLHVTTGDAVAVIGPDGVARTVRVAGLLDEPMGTYVYAPLAGLRNVTGVSTPTSALLAFAPAADRGAIRRAVTALPMVVASQDTRALKRTVDGFMGLFVAMVGAMLVLGCLLAFAIIFTTMSVNIVERTREIATLRTGGVHRRAVAALVAGENLLITALGIAPGLLLGVVGGRAYLASYSNDQMRFELVVRPTTLIVAALAVLVVAALSQWPGLRAVDRLDLAQAVRERA